MLESALGRPQNKFAYEEADLAELAAVPMLSALPKTIRLFWIRDTLKRAKPKSV
jgi:hypothetical protein